MCGTRKSNGNERIWETNPVSLAKQNVEFMLQ